MGSRPGAWWAIGVVGLLAAALSGYLLLRAEDEAPGRPSPADLVREGTRPVITRYGDLDGDGVEEVMISSVAELSNESGFGLPPPYLDVFAYRDGAWRKVLGATEGAPPGPGTPPVMIDAQNEEFAFSQAVQVLEVVDFAADGASEMVAGVLTAGASAGPLELWVVSMGTSGSFRTELYESTSRGGEVTVRGDTVLFEFGVYREGDPGCCPSTIETQTIGFDPATGRIGVVERTSRPSGLG